MTAQLTCPKCHAPMRSYERNRVLVDQCTGCGGLFLDRGELEALVAAETAWHAQQQAPGPSDGVGGYLAIGEAHPYSEPAAQAYGQAPHAKHSKAYRRQTAYASSRAPMATYSTGHRRYRKRRSFLSELFDD